MAHEHSIYDSDLHFKIDPVTREIKNESEKVVLMQHDHNSERFTFEIPKEVDGHDMSLCNVCQIHYLNIEASTKVQYEGIYEVDDLQISPDSDDVVICSWLLSGNVTQYVGPLSFTIRFACVADDGTVEYAWHTNIHSGISIGDTIYNSDVIAAEYADILEEWRAALFFGSGESNSDKNMGGYRLLGLPTPVNDDEAANKGYVDESIANIDAISANEKGISNGVATLDGNGKVTAGQACSSVKIIADQSSYTLMESDVGKFLMFTFPGGSVSSCTVTIPPSFAIGSEFEVMKGNASPTITFVPGDGALLRTRDVSANASLSISEAYGVAAFKQITSTIWLVVGDVE